MRIIEPRNYRHDSVKGQSKKRVFFLSILLVLTVGGSGFWYLKWGQNNDSPAQATSLPAPEIVDITDEDKTPQTEAVETEPASEASLFRTFNDNDFKLFYDQLKQPGVSVVSNPPPITGNVAADERIQTIAEKRGYRLRGTPSKELGSIEGYPVQSLVVKDWLALKNAAATQGHDLSLVSAYRSINHQKTLFLSRLNAAGASIDQVAAGKADDKVNEVLKTSSIPGYSKHHTGYTIDILCAGWAFENFKNSDCNTWMSANNYEQAKSHGFIPSYPPTATSQGPNPEAWEYVWVGVDLLRK